LTTGMRSAIMLLGDSMVEKALVIRAEGNSHVLEFSPQDLRDVISDIVRTDDIIGILFLDRLYSYPERDRCPALVHPPAFPAEGEGSRGVRGLREGGWGVRLRR
jgi:hypothetical protein